MSQLLIIDVQNTYRSYIPKELINKLPAHSENFSEILYLWDNISGQDYYSEIPEEWLEEENESFYNRLNSFTKNYAFIRGFMDKGVNDEDIVSLGKFLLSHNIHDGRGIIEDEDVSASYNEQFKNTSLIDLSFEDYTFYLPDDLIDELRSRLRDGVTVVGGGTNECLKEVCLLLNILEIGHTVDHSFTY